MKHKLLVLLLLIGLTGQSCSYNPLRYPPLKYVPYLGVKGEEVPQQFPSVFSNKGFLDIKEYEFVEYQWNNDAKISEDIYIRGLVDFYFRKQYKKAVVVFESALKININDARVYTRLIECYARLDEYDKALEIINLANDELKGFGANPGITSYRREIADLQFQLIAETGQGQKRNIFLRILFFPAKLWPF